MKDVSIKQLRYFKALAQHRHFGRAAEACSVSQPAISLQVKELEETLGVQLVERGNRRTKLTDLGVAIADRVQKILREVDELGSYARSVQPTLTGELRIGAISTVAPYLLPAVVKNLNRHYPGLQVRPREAITQKLVADLLDAELDAALLALPVAEPSLSSIELLEEEFVLVRSFEDAEKPVPDAKMLREMELLLLEEGHCFRDQALSFCGAPRYLMQGSSLSTLVQMVGAGIGVTLIPKMAITLETRSANVSVARLPPPRPTRSIGLVWRKTHPLSEQLTEIADIIV